MDSNRANMDSTKQKNQREKMFTYTENGRNIHYGPLPLDSLAKRDYTCFIVCVLITGNTYQQVFLFFYLLHWQRFQES